MPKIVNHETYREELLEKGFDLFANKGYTITMRELASGLKVSTHWGHFLKNIPIYQSQHIAFINLNEIIVYVVSSPMLVAHFHKL